MTKKIYLIKEILIIYYYHALLHMINSSALYGKRESLQLPVTAISEIYKAGKVWTVMMLRESRDVEIRNSPPDVKTARKWSAEEETDGIVSSLEHRNIVGATESG